MEWKLLPERCWGNPPEMATLVFLSIVITKGEEEDHGSARQT
jgi:hypothetical protein